MLQLSQSSIHKHTGCLTAERLLSQAMPLLLQAVQLLLLLHTSKQVGDAAAVHPGHSLQLFTAPTLADQSARRCC
jgi:hypothetical protein